jgi:outer membrane protein assembly factor BamB
MICLALFLLLMVPRNARAEDWPGWRGPRGDGSSLDERPPLHWNGATGENIAWKTPIPGVGHASPIVSGDRVFVTSCLEGDGRRVLIALDRHSGQIAWQQTVIEAPLEKRHKLNSRASGTPATDGELVYVSFLEADFASDNERTPGWSFPAGSPARTGSARRRCCSRIW